MTNFVYDNTELPYPKEDLGTLPLGADPKKWTRAIDWNTVCQGLVDVQAFCRGAAWLGMQAHASDPSPGSIANYIWLHSNGTLMKTVGGVASAVGVTADDSITNDKLAEMPASTFKANNTGGVANPADITVAQARTLLGLAAVATSGAAADVAGLAAVATSGAAADVSGLAAIAESGSADDLSSGTVPAVRMPALTGDVTTSAGDVATTIGANKVLNTMLAQMAAGTLKGNDTGGAANAADLTATQVTAMLDVATALAKGLLPALSGNASDTLKGDGTWGAGGGGYKGAWAAGTYAAGSIVRRGPFTFGNLASTSVDPCDVSNMGSASDWTLSHNGSGSQSGTVMTLNNGTLSRSSAGYRQAVASWKNRLIVCDATVGPSGGADIFFFGFYDSTLTQTSTLISREVGAYGVVINIWNAGSGTSVHYINNGVSGGAVTVASSGQAAGNEILENNRQYRHYAEFTESGANMIITLWRDSYDLNTTAGVDQPGFVATWTITKPSFTNSRLVVGSETGGVAGNFRVQNTYAIDRSGAWDVLSVLPYAPRIDAAIWR